ncbi:hypothetical protein [Pengzhenrongella sicca]|uniref:hypothetical protein n=1 Tax=Pengzhenrongella sicca TaxID=2819238 RepID=UPI0029C9FF4F|nr:hypothetical protein [Pengzhenrongella sicca]
MTAPVLARANPLAKLAGALVLTVVLLLSVDWVSACVALAFELAVVPLAGLTYRGLALRGWPILAAATLSGYSTAVLADPSGPVVIRLGAVAVSAGAIAAAWRSRCARSRSPCRGFSC